MKKICNVCKLEKDVEKDFYKQKRGKHGVRAECKKCFSRHAPKEMQHRKDRRIEVITMYGGKCVCCGDTTIEHLVIDHINGNGNIERLTWKNSNSMYLELKRRGYPTDNYQVLCHNCNITKHIYGKPAMQIHNEQKELTEGYLGEGI